MKLVCAGNKCRSEPFALHANLAAVLGAAQVVSTKEIAASELTGSGSADARSVLVTVMSVSAETFETAKALNYVIGKVEGCINEYHTTIYTERPERGDVLVATQGIPVTDSLKNEFSARILFLFTGTGPEQSEPGMPVLGNAQYKAVRRHKKTGVAMDSPERDGQQFQSFKTLVAGCISK